MLPSKTECRRLTTHYNRLEFPKLLNSSVIQPTDRTGIPYLFCTVDSYPLQLLLL